MLSCGKLASVREVFRSLSGLDGLDCYMVSNLGRVKSLLGRKKKHGRIMSPRSNWSGYPQVGLRGRTYSVHKLVAFAFLGPRPDGTDVNHKDLNKENNRVDNLEYTTRQGNVDHYWENVEAGVVPPKRNARRIGRVPPKDRRVWEPDSVQRAPERRGAHASELNARTVLVHEFLKRGRTQREVAAMFGVSQMVIWRESKRPTPQGF